MVINDFMAFQATESGVEIIGFVADPLHVGWKMTKDRRAGIVVAKSRDLKRAGLALRALAKLG